MSAVGQIALDETRRRVGEQIATINAIRSLAGSIIAGATVVAGVFGAVLVNGDALSYFVALAGILSVIAAGSAFAAAWATRLGHPLNVDKIDVAAYHDSSDPELALARHLESKARENDKVLTHRWRLLNASLVILVASVITWIIALATR